MDHRRDQTQEESGEKGQDKKSGCIANLASDERRHEWFEKQVVEQPDGTSQKCNGMREQSQGESGSRIHYSLS
jgi:hypothetical protein